MNPISLGARHVLLPPDEWRKILRDPELRLVSRWEDPARGLKGAVSADGEVYAFRIPATGKVKDLTLRQAGRVLDGLPPWREARGWCVFLDDQRDPPRHSSEVPWEVVRSGAPCRALITSLTDHDVLVRVSWDQHLSSRDPDTGESLLRWLLAEHPGRASLCRMDFHTADELAKARMQELMASFLAAPSAACGSPILHLRRLLEEGGPLSARALQECQELGFFERY
jgi:hypothetical protein